MTPQRWKIISGLTLALGVAFLVGAFATGTTSLYAIAAVWFALAAYFGRKAAA